MTTDPPAVTLGIDFGTLSGRVLVVSVDDGAELGSAVHEYAHGVVDRELPRGVPLPPDWALQIPQDWRDVLRLAVPRALADADVTPEQVVGIATDFTACTVLPTTWDGTPLCELPEYRDRPHAHPKLWRHHAAQPEADLIVERALRSGQPWLARYGGRISSEWQYAKALQVLREDPGVYAAADRWIEAADWIVWQLTGAESRNPCTAGYKGIHQDGRYPGEAFLAGLHPDFTGFTAKLEHPLTPLGAPAGRLTPRAAALTGLREGTVVAVGNVDAHVTCAAAQALDPGRMLAIMGTSTCHILNSDVLAEVPGMCGVVRDGVVPGLWGYEAGQSGVGDILAWAVRNAVPDEYAAEARSRGMDVHELLTERASAQPVGAHGLLALDWHSGNRSVLVDHHLSGLVLGLTLDTRPEDVYRALIEATAFGTRTIVEAFETAGVPVTDFTAAGGLLRNRFLMQVYSDVLNRPVHVLASTQGPALGAAIHAAVAAGAHPDIRTASAAMGRRQENAYTPDPARSAAYDRLYAEYRALHDHFGRGGSDVMHRLRALRSAALAAHPTT
ncbi:ribulokinase [Streptomyces griseofuscus]|uniref:Ribulokinase n=1 Tax=Streptomyces griseofuscus TaxID=146922 RepID=A0A3R8RD72_9ACTN|nr:ribulokinase [Streptomyces griseofuscus]RRQ76721.1 ribulokinase [Streptomyces griseofuscus]RRQ86124.1 ribulokinase [Streptomyces griseofuscus]